MNVDHNNDDDWVEPLKKPDDSLDRLVLVRGVCELFESNTSSISNNNTSNNSMDPVFEMLFKPLDDPHFKPTERLEMLDKQLEEMYAKSSLLDDTNIVNDVENCSEEDVYKYAQILEIEPTEAFEQMRRCARCKRKDIKFGKLFCNYWCEIACKKNKTIEGAIVNLLKSGKEKEVILLGKRYRHYNLVCGPMLVVNCIDK